MTELEKIEYAKSFIDKLAEGINPLDDTPLKDDDIVNNVRLSRCFFYVSDILRQVIAKGGLVKRKSPKTDKLPFSLTLEQVTRFQYSSKPLPLSVLANKLYETAENENMQKLGYQKIADWLIAVGMLKVIPQSDGKKVKRPTTEGEALGICLENRTGLYGEYQTVVYSEKAQRFIVDNIDAIVAYSNGDDE